MRKNKSSSPFMNQKAPSQSIALVAPRPLVAPRMFRPKSPKSASKPEFVLVAGLRNGTFLVVASRTPAMPSRWHAVEAACLQQSHSISCDAVAGNGISHFVATCGRDGEVRVWDAQTFCCICKCTLPAAAVSIDQHENYIAWPCRRADQFLQIRRKRWVQMCVACQHTSISKAKRGLEGSGRDSNAKILPIGCDHRSRLSGQFYLPARGQEPFACLGVLRGHSSFVLAVDWGADEKFLRSNDASREVIFWNVAPSKGQKAKIFTAAEVLKDYEWDRPTLLYGWGVSGIWATQEMLRTLIVCRKLKTWLRLAMTECVRLYRRPCLPGAIPKLYHGHHSHVLAARWTV